MRKDRHRQHVRVHNRTAWTVDRTSIEDPDSIARPGCDIENLAMKELVSASLDPLLFVVSRFYIEILIILVRFSYKRAK